MSKKTRSRVPPAPQTGVAIIPQFSVADPVGPVITPPAMAAAPFALDTGAKLIRKDGTYLAVVANATIDGVPSVIVQGHTATGDRTPHPQAPHVSDGHAPLSLAEIERQIAAGEFEFGSGIK